MQANGTVNIGDSESFLSSAQISLLIFCYSQTECENDYMIERAINIVFVKLSDML